MKNKIVYDSVGRIRFRCGQAAFKRTDEKRVERYLLSYDFVTTAKSSATNGGILITYSVDRRSDVISVVNKLNMQELCVSDDDSSLSEEIDERFRSDLTKIVIKRLIPKFLIPTPLRPVITVIKSVKYIANGLGQLLTMNVNVDVLDGASITACLAQKDYKTAGSVMFLLSVSSLLESYTKERAKAALTESLMIKTDKLWLRMVGDFDNDCAHYEYSLDGASYKLLGREMPLSYQLISFQGSRHALFAFNHKGRNGGYAEFDNFIVEEPLADRSHNIPYGKSIRIINLATKKPMKALTHGLLYDTDAKDNTPQTRFRVIDRGQGKVILQCEDGRYIFCAGFGIAGDVRLTTDESRAEVFLWQDYLNHEFMLMSMRNHRYIGKSPTTGSPYSMDFTGSDPARRNGAVFRWICE